MDEHPLPPSGQDEIDKIPLVLVARRQKWHRIHTRGEDPLHYGRSGYRFDSLGGGFGVLYVAEKVQGAFIETFGRTLGVRDITLRKLALRTIAVFESDDLALIDLTGKGASAAGADGRLCTATNYNGLTRPWAEAFHRHKEKADGILYRARHDLNEVVAAVFDRARTKIKVVEELDFSKRKGRALIMRVVHYYGFGIIP